MRKRKICVVTGTRAEYGLLYCLLKEIENDSDLELQLIVTGMHLSPEFGLTYKEIEKDFKITKKIEIVLSSDTPIGVSKSIGLGLISFAEVYEELKPDILLILGDRYEVLSAAIAAMVSRIPIAHISGGELTFGVIDDSIRHAITKMSHIHFVATEEYKNRVIQLGENEEYVFIVGEIGLDNIFNLELLSKEEFEKTINLKLNKKNILFTYHPTTLDTPDKIEEDIDNILKFLETLEDTNIVFTKSNSDVGGRIINHKIDNFVAKHPKNTVAFSSLGRLIYLSALKYVDAVVGNSSSGIVESPSFKIGTINIGNRQSGRVMAESVINCSAIHDSLRSAFNKLYSKEFQQMLEKVVNPYYKGGASLKIKNILKTIQLEGIIYKRFKDKK